MSADDTSWLVPGVRVTCTLDGRGRTGRVHVVTHVRPARGYASGACVGIQLVAGKPFSKPKEVDSCLVRPAPAAEVTRVCQGCECGVPCVDGEHRESTDIEWSNPGEIR